MKYAILLFSLMLSTQSFAILIGQTEVISEAGYKMTPEKLPFTTTSLPILIIMDTNENLSLDELMPELQAEINQGPAQYFYLRALAKKLSLEEKYQGNEEQSLTDIISDINAQTIQ